jgi:hypothetical protein
LRGSPARPKMVAIIAPLLSLGIGRALNERERDERDDEIARLKSKVGEITMDNKLLCAKIAAMEAPPHWLLLLRR